MKRLLTLLIIFLFGCSPGNKETTESSNGGEEASSLIVNITCPATSTAGLSVQCTASIDGVATFKQWSVDGAAVNVCANQDTCNISTPSAKAYKVLMLATDEFGQFAQSNEATITVGGSSHNVTLTCPATGTVGTALNCTINKTGSFASHYYKVANSRQASCDNLATCPITPSAAGTLSIIGVGVKADGTEVTSAASSITISGTSSAGGSITLTCPSSATVNSSVSCSVVKSANVTSHYFKLNNTTRVCDNLITCTGTAPSTPSTWTVQAFGMVGSTEISSSVASITVTTGSSGASESINLTCSTTTAVVGQSVTCNATSATTSWVAGTWMIKGTAYGGCSNLASCTGAPDAAGNWTVQVIGTLPGGRQVPSNTVTVAVTAPASNQINITCTPNNPTAGQFVTCNATSALTFTSGYWMLNTTQLCANNPTCTGQLPAGSYTVYAVGFVGSTRYESNRITLNVR